MSLIDRKVVVTGLGVLTPLGNSVDAFWEKSVAGESGIDLVTAFDTSDYACKIGGEVRDFEPKDVFSNPKDARRNDRFTHLALGAAKQAFEDSGIDINSIDPTRIGAMVGTGIGGIKTMEKQHGTLTSRSPSKVSPFTIPMMIANIASGVISMEFGLEGPNMCIVTACATASHNIGEAWRMIKFGDADMFLAGGAEGSISVMAYSGFGNMRALSTRNDEPQKASRPFDKGRDGFVMGEGAGILVLEEESHARKRGAKIYGEIAGYGLSADAHHLTAPHPEGYGAARCMRMALNHAGVNPEDVAYVNAHGTSTPAGDLAETLALKETFGDHAKNGLLVSSTKSMTGHLLGAAGSVEAAASILAMNHGIIPPTVNLDEPDPECDLDYIPNVARETEFDLFVSNSFGFGGHNATIVGRKYAG